MKNFFEKFEYFYRTGENHLSKNEMPKVKRLFDLRIADYYDEILELKDFLYRKNPTYHSGIAVEIGADIEHLYDLIELCRYRKRQLWKLNRREKYF